MAKSNNVPFLLMSQEERAAIMASNKPEIEVFNASKIELNWSWKGCGFGQLYLNKYDGVFEISAEKMSKENVRTILYAMVDHILENVETDKDGRL